MFVDSWKIDANWAVIFATEFTVLYMELSTEFLCIYFLLFLHSNLFLS